MDNAKNANNELQIEGFAAWALAAQLATMPATQRPDNTPDKTAATATTRAFDSYPEPIQKALMVLEKLKLVPNATDLTIGLISKSQLSDLGAGTPKGDIPAAVTTIGSRRIYVVRESTAFVGASKGDDVQLMNLASVIAHEWWHQTNGTSEKGAYDFQLKALNAMHAPSSLIQRVNYVRAEVLNNLKKSGLPQ